MGSGWWRLCGYCRRFGPAGRLQVGVEQRQLAGIEHPERAAQKRVHPSRQRQGRLLSPPLTSASSAASRFAGKDNGCRLRSAASAARASATWCERHSARISTITRSLRPGSRSRHARASCTACSQSPRAGSGAPARLGSTAAGAAPPPRWSESRPAPSIRADRQPAASRTRPLRHHPGSSRRSLPLARPAHNPALGARPTRTRSAPPLLRQWPRGPRPSGGGLPTPPSRAPRRGHKYATHPPDDHAPRAGVPARKTPCIGRQPGRLQSQLPNSSPHVAAQRLPPRPSDRLAGSLIGGVMRGRPYAAAVRRGRRSRRMAGSESLHLTQPAARGAIRRAGVLSHRR